MNSPDVWPENQAEEAAAYLGVHAATYPTFDPRNNPFVIGSLEAASWAVAFALARHLLALNP